MSDHELNAEPGIVPYNGIKNTVAPGFVSVYANNVEAAATLFDASLVFGEILGVSDGTLTVEQKARVVLPLAQMKMLTFILIRQLKIHESNFGKIELHSSAISEQVRDIVEQWEKTKNK